MENVNIRLAPWEIAHLSNHKHPHVSLQCSGVLGEWGGAEVGGAVTSSDLYPWALRAEVSLGGGGLHVWGLWAS